MKTAIKTILIGIVLLASAGQAFAYPPDNAAVLYYKSFMLLEEPNDSMKQMLRDLKDGNIGLNEQIRQYVEKNRKVIGEIVTAAEIKNCDWGLDFSEGFSLEIPHLVKCRQMAYILTADAKVLAEKGDYKAALERCITIHKVGIHVGDDTLISYLVDTAIKGIANKCIMDILPQVSGDCEMLEWLKVRLADISSRCPSLRAAIANETEIYWQHINKEEIVAMIEADVSVMPKDKLEQILQGDDEFFARTREYYQRFMAEVQSAFDLPYPQAKQDLEDLYREVENASKEKPEAIMAGFLFSSIYRICAIDTRGKTHLNAVLAAIDIYLIKAKSGKLPDELPAGLPKDMFSGKDFLYEKTDAGFTLTGQGKDLDKDIVQKYEFKVAK
jgi:GrpB-like predicted nucleotidyltransferase (UPF0157 family)